MHVGLFDSGVGGISVLQAVRDLMPRSALSYFADARHAPYGERDEEHVLMRSHAVAQHLIDQGARLLVVACNTATAIAIDALRERWPMLPIVGVEPGVKPAVALSRNMQIAVMATPTTLGSHRFEQLIGTHAGCARIHLIPCPGLAGLIERDNSEPSRLFDLLAGHCARLRRLNVDVVVLGCTHYSFVRDVIERMLGPGVAVIDTAHAVAQQVRRLASTVDGCSAAQVNAAAPALRVMASDDGHGVRTMVDRWLGVACQVETWPKV